MRDHGFEPSFQGDPPAATDPEALVDRRELAVVALERTRMPIVVTDPRKEDNPIVLANQAFLDLTGYTSDEVLGRNCRFLQGPDTGEPEIEAIRRGIANGDEHVDIEILNYRKDGSTFWNQLSISPVHDEHGALLYHFASQKDVTARRRAQALEAAERQMLMEVDHRALNALAIVRSIVNLTAADTTEQYVAAVRARIDSIARAHRMLAKMGWTAAELADILAMEVPAGFNERVEIGGPSVRLGAKFVQPVTLVIHELMANAVEHGALSREDGRVTIEWEDQQDHVLLRWRERGGPKPQDAPSLGFGLSIADGIIARQLRGKLDMNWSSEGLDACITIPGDRAAN
jgi:PAS domain S-box-containing protein